MSLAKGDRKGTQDSSHVMNNFFFAISSFYMRVSRVGNNSSHVCKLYLSCFLRLKRIYFLLLDIMQVILMKCMVRSEVVCVCGSDMRAWHRELFSGILYSHNEENDWRGIEKWNGKNERLSFPAKKLQDPIFLAKKVLLVLWVSLQVFGIRWEKK